MKFTKQTASELPDPSRPSIQSHVSRYIENIHPKWTHKTIWKDVILERIDPFFNHPFFRGHFRSFYESRATYVERQPYCLLCYTVARVTLFVTCGVRLRDFNCRKCSEMENTYNEVQTSNGIWWICLSSPKPPKTPSLLGTQNPSKWLWTFPLESSIKWANYYSFGGCWVNSRTFHHQIKQIPNRIPNPGNSKCRDSKGRDAILPKLPRLRWINTSLKEDPQNRTRLLWDLAVKCGWNRMLWNPESKHAKFHGSLLGGKKNKTAIDNQPIIPTIGS